MIRCSCHGLHGWVPTDERPIPSESTSVRSCARRSPSRSAHSAKVSQRPVRTSTSDAISSPTRWGSSSVPCAACCTSSKRLTSSSVLGSRSANSSSTATVKSGTSSKAAFEAVRSSSYPTFCSSPTAASLVVEGLEEALGAPCPAPVALDGPPRREAECAPLDGRQREQLAQARAERLDVAVRKQRQMRVLRRILRRDAGADLCESGVIGDDRRNTGRGRFRRHHPERLGEHRRHDCDVTEWQQVDEVPVL